MSDAFDNYCITCDQLCTQNSIYCSESCKHIDEAQASSVSTTLSNLQGFVSPLLTPSIYQHYNEFNTTTGSSAHPNFSEYLTDSPLMLLKQNSLDLEYHSFDLNAPLDSTIVPSTSNNYRKWLTACL